MRCNLLVDQQQKQQQQQRNDNNHYSNGGRESYYFLPSDICGPLSGFTGLPPFLANLAKLAETYGDQLGGIETDRQELAVVGLFK